MKPVKFEFFFWLTPSFRALVKKLAFAWKKNRLHNKLTPTLRDPLYAIKLTFFWALTFRLRPHGFCASLFLQCLCLRHPYATWSASLHEYQIEARNIAKNHFHKLMSKIPCHPPGPPTTKSYENHDFCMFFKRIRSSRPRSENYKIVEKSLFCLGFCESYLWKM